MSTRVYPVSTINRYIHDVVTSDEILADVWIEGEVTRITTPRSGHIYFTFTEGNATLDAVMWKGNAVRQRFIPRPGDVVVIHGQADFYEAQGRFQIQADVFEHQGQGLLALEFERLRQRLEAEGLFDPARKRPLPHFPRRIGVVTSATGAVWHDIQTVSRHRYPLVELILFPAAVQGAAAPAQLAAAIRLANGHDLDLLIVGRGGGSPEDLAPFNAEEVARAVFASRLPIVSAVGHETDVSICDMVADLRAATPSHAAELALPHMGTLLRGLAEQRLRAEDAVALALRERHRTLALHTQRMELHSPRQRLRRLREALTVHGDRIARAVDSGITRRRLRADAGLAVLRALDPTAVLRRGFALVQHSGTGKPITSAGALADGTDVRVRFADSTASGTLRRSDDPKDHP